MAPLAVVVGVPACVFIGTSGAAVTGAQHSYPAVSLGSLYHSYSIMWPDSGGGLVLPDPDVPHLPEPAGTYYTSVIAAGTASTMDVRQVYGDLWWRNWYPPDLTGD
jgi:hypothetical protein